MKNNSTHGNKLPASIQEKYNDFEKEHVYIKRSFITTAIYVLVITPIIYNLYVLGAFDVGGFLDNNDAFQLDCERIGAKKCVRGLDTLDSIILTILVVISWAVAAGFKFMKGRTPDEL